MAMEETPETAADELELRDDEHQLSGDSMDGPLQTQNQDTSNAMEEIIDDNNGEAATEDNDTSDKEGQ